MSALLNGNAVSSDDVCIYMFAAVKNAKKKKSKIVVALGIEPRTISEHVQWCERDIITEEMLEKCHNVFSVVRAYPLDHATFTEQSRWIMAEMFLCWLMIAQKKCYLKEV
jgi:hypothetical protein